MRSKRAQTMTNDPNPTNGQDSRRPPKGPSGSRRGLLAASALIGAGLGASGTTTSVAANEHDADDGDHEGMNGEATVSFEDQATGGTWVNVASATLSEGGFMTIHDSSLLDGNVFGSVIGVSDVLEPGDHEGIVVQLFEGVPGQEFDREMIDDGETLIAMPHFDSNESGEYEFITTEGEEDGPYVDEDGDPIVDDAMITVDDDEMDDTHGFSLQEIVDNPENYYVDIHTEDNPEGAARGQLRGEPGQTEFAVELGSDEVVDGGTESATGTAELVLDPNEEVICFHISVCRVTPPYESPANTATHIHEAEEGEAGPPVVVFPDPRPRDPNADGRRSSSGCLPGELAFETGVE